MSTDSADGLAKPANDVGGESRSYEAPTVVVLGTVAELTQLGNTAGTELDNDGSQI